MAVYSTPLRYVLLPALRQVQAGKATARDWDRMMTGAFASYLERTPEVATRDVLIAALLHRHCAPASVLDIGCGSGSLAAIMSRYRVSAYLGLDISELAVTKANESCEREPAQYPADTRFVASDLRQFSCPDESSFGAMCFSEVLYYIDEPSEAVREVERYCRWLAPGGLIGVSMKDDPKSHAIFNGLAKHHEWVTGTLYQEQSAGPAFRITISRERPGFLIGLFKPGSNVRA